nr:response regulator [candidate division Zixibacteria bacterium]
MKTPTLLIVDDEEKNIKLLKAMLMAENYNLRGALSGKEALRMVDETLPDLILLDVMMAEIDGF